MGVLLPQGLHPQQQPGQGSPDVVGQVIELALPVGRGAVHLMQQAIDAVGEQLERSDAAVEHQGDLLAGLPGQGFEQLVERLPQLPLQEGHNPHEPAQHDGQHHQQPATGGHQVQATVVQQQQCQEQQQ